MFTTFHSTALIGAVPSQSQISSRKLLQLLLKHWTCPLCRWFTISAGTGSAEMREFLNLLFEGMGHTQLLCFWRWKGPANSKKLKIQQAYVHRLMFQKNKLGSMRCPTPSASTWIEKKSWFKKKTVLFFSTTWFFTNLSQWCLPWVGHREFFRNLKKYQSTQPCFPVKNGIIWKLKPQNGRIQSQCTRRDIVHRKIWGHTHECIENVGAITMNASKMLGQYPWVHRTFWGHTHECIEKFDPNPNSASKSLAPNQ